jgi:hypothetical protein
LKTVDKTRKMVDKMLETVDKTGKTVDNILDIPHSME